MNTVLRYKEKTWTIEEGCCPITLKLNHPKFGMLEIDKFQRTEEKCKEIERTKEVVWLGDTYKVDVWVAKKEQMSELGYTFDWYYLTIKENNCVSD